MVLKLKSCYLIGEIKMKSSPVAVGNIQQLTQNAFPSLSSFGKDFPSFPPAFIGFDSYFDKLFSDLGKELNYPPYNIVRKDDNHFTIEIALAGFTKDQLEISVEKNTLEVKSVQREETVSKEDFVQDISTEVKYVHKGISSKSFVRKFKLTDEIQVVGSTFVNGMLSIQLEKVVPEQAVKRLISID